MITHRFLTRSSANKEDDPLYRTRLAGVDSARGMEFGSMFDAYRASTEVERAGDMVTRQKLFRNAHSLNFVYVSSYNRLNSLEFPSWGLSLAELAPQGGCNFLVHPALS